MTRRPRRGNVGRVLISALLCKRAGNKRMFVSEGDALKVVERSHRDPKWKNVHGQPARRAYLCKHCGWWHLTSKKEAE